jgi:hypothetical protein
MRRVFSMPVRSRFRPAGPPLPDSTGGERADEPLFSEAFLARLRRLVLLTGRSMSEGLAGEHRSRRRGSSPEFADFKSYSQGDDFRRIDWNSYARLDGLFVRLSEVTTELSIHLLLDASNSMDWRSRPALPTKFTYGRRVAGAFGYIGLWHFDRLTLVPFGSELAPPFGPVQGRANVLPMLRFLERLPALGGTDVAAAIERYIRARRRPGILILISDLLSGDVATLRSALRFGCERGWHIVVVQTLDDAEVTPAMAAQYVMGDAAAAGGRPPAELVEVESGERLRLSPTDGVLERYGAAITGWLQEIETACAEEQAEYIRLLTSWPIDTMVLRLLHERGMVA